MLMRKSAKRRSERESKEELGDGGRVDIGMSGKERVLGRGG
jgi:hypothetical protein